MSSGLQTPTTAGRDRTSVIRVWLAAFTAALVLYVLTAHRGVQWQDSGWQQLRIVTGQIEHPLGLALTHPLHYYLGRAALTLLPWLEPAFAITLVSSLAAALAVANVAATVFILAGGVLPVLIPTLALALSHTFWQYATHTESYALVAALLSAEWLCVALFARTRCPRFLLMLALANGLGIGNHMLAVLATPVDVALLIWAWRSRLMTTRCIALAGLCWAVGTLPYSLLVVATAFSSGDGWGALHSALFGDFPQQVLNVAVRAKLVVLSLGYLLYNFPGAVIPLAVVGLVRRGAENQLFRIVLGAELLIFALFAVRYTIPDQYTYFIPVYAGLALLAGIGLKQVGTLASLRWRQAILGAALLTAVWTPIVYATTARVLSASGALAGLVGNRPYRDGYREFFLPWGVGKRDGERLSDAVFTVAGDEGLIVLEATMTRFALEYAQALGRAPQAVTITSIRELRARSQDEPRRILEQYLTGGRVVLQIPADRDHPAEIVSGAIWTRVGDVYVLERLEEQNPRP